MAPLNGAVRYLSAGGVGVCAGATLGLVGWGGAQVIKPSLTSPSLIGCSPLQATATSLFSLSVAVVAGGSQFLQAGNACLPVAAALALPSVLGARWGSRVAGKLSADQLSLIFNGGSVLLLPTHYLVQHSRRSKQLELEHAPVSDHTRSGAECDEAAKLETAMFHIQQPLALLGHACFGYVTGVLSALMGVGGLPVVMSYLTLASPLPHHLIQGTAMCSVAPSVLTSALTHVQSGATPLRVAAAVTAGSVTGVALGAQLALSLPEQRLRELFMASLVVLGGRSFVGALRNSANIIRRGAK